MTIVLFVVKWEIHPDKTDPQGSRYVLGSTGNGIEVRLVKAP